MNSAPESHVLTQELIVLENPMKGYEKWYYVLISLSCLTFIAIGGLIFGILNGFVIGWGLAYMIVNGIAGMRLLKLNFAKHPMSMLITNEQLYKHLTTFSHPDFKVEKGRKHVRFEFINKTTHTVLIDEKKQTYSIVSKFRKKVQLQIGIILELKNTYMPIPPPP